MPLLGVSGSGGLKLWVYPTITIPLTLFTVLGWWTAYRLQARQVRVDEELLQRGVVETPETASRLKNGLDAWRKKKPFRRKRQ